MLSREFRITINLTNADNSHLGSIRFASRIASGLNNKLNGASARLLAMIYPRPGWATKSNDEFRSSNQAGVEVISLTSRARAMAARRPRVP
jgi:hypothetical protein